MGKTSISIEDAKAWTKNYQGNMRSGDAKAFLISCDTIVDILKEMKVIQEDSRGNITLHNIKGSNIRAYMAKNPKQTEANGQTLVMVGTMKDSGGTYRDMVKEEINPPYNPSDLDGSGAFDFTKPCPIYCDENSPLNH